MLKNDIKYSDMKKDEVLSCLSNLKTSWTVINYFIEGLPPHWFRKPIKHIMKIDVDFHNAVITIEKSLKLRLKDIYFALDANELSELVKRSKTLEIQDISLSLELQDNEKAYVDGSKDTINDKGEVIKVSPSVINYTIKEIKKDISDNRKNIKQIEEEEKALALLLRKKYF
jgi:hypothetical protein